MPSYFRHLRPNVLSAWQVSSACSMSTCVSVLNLGHVVLIRDSKNGADAEQPIIELGSQRWANFVAAVAGAGEFDGSTDVPVTGGGVEVVAEDAGSILLSDATTGTTLRFTDDEWQAFADGVRAGEFDVGSETSRLESVV